MRRPAFALLSVCLLAACAGSRAGGRPTAPPGRPGVTYTELPVEGGEPAEGAAEEAAAAEPAAEEPAEEPAAEEPRASGTTGQPACRLDATRPPAAQHLAVFRRWLRDQSVGRGATIEEVLPVCGDRGGSMVVRVTASGPAGGLHSLARALESYYPGSSWYVQRHERLEGDDYPLRVVVEIRIPVGAAPRPRCVWDPAVSCPEQPRRGESPAAEHDE